MIAIDLNEVERFVAVWISFQILHSGFKREKR